MKLLSRGGETAWRFGFRRRLPKRPTSARETVWQWISTATGPSFCGQPGGGTSWRNWSRRSSPEIVIAKRTGDSRRERSPGERHLCAGYRRFHLADIRSSGWPRAGGPTTGARPEPANIQREIRPGFSLPHHESGEGIPVLSRRSGGARHNRRNPFRSHEERRLESAPRGKSGAMPKRRGRRSSRQISAASRVLKSGQHQRITAHSLGLELNCRCGRR